MSNWKACIPANPKYDGAKNLIWVMNVSVVPNESASIKVQVQYQKELHHMLKAFNQYPQAQLLMLRGI